MPTYKPTQEDADRIKQAAAREGQISLGAVLLEPGLRNGPKEVVSMNPLVVTDDPDWNDTDLDDYGTWAEFRKGVELTPDGRGVVDFYIRKRGDEYKDLCGNVTIEIEDGKLVRIYGYGNSGDYFNAKGAR